MLCHAAHVHAGGGAATCQCRHGMGHVAEGSIQFHGQYDSPVLVCLSGRQRSMGKRATAVQTLLLIMGPRCKPELVPVASSPRALLLAQ